MGKEYAMGKEYGHSQTSITGWRAKNKQKRGVCIRWTGVPRLDFDLILPSFMITSSHKGIKEK